MEVQVLSRAPLHLYGYFYHGLHPRPAMRYTEARKVSIRMTVVFPVVCRVKYLNLFWQ